MNRKTRMSHQSRPIPSTDSTVAAATVNAAIAQILDELEEAQALLATAHAAATLTEDVDPTDLQITMGLALVRLRAGMERIRAIQPANL